jgi:protein involved in polysaccharide export with SLBB domain
MKKHNVICSLVLSLSLILAAVAATDDSSSLQLSLDDEISITLLNKPDMSIKEIKVGTNGNIFMPSLGQIIIKRLTVT